MKKTRRDTMRCAPGQPPGVQFRTAPDMLAECARLFSELKAGMDVDRVRTAAYVLQTAGAILRMTHLERRLSEVERTLAHVVARAARY